MKSVRIGAGLGFYGDSWRPVAASIERGVRREGVTDAAGKLQKLGVIEYSRGHITVLDRPRLEQLSCECYAVVKHESDRLLPYLPRPAGA